MDDRQGKARERESLLTKIRALLAKTVENGATEAEALAAAAKAAEIMARHDLSMDDLDVKESGVERKRHPLDPVLRAHLTLVGMAIAELCQTRFWTDGGGAAATDGTFFGLAHDVEVAGYLFSICENAMRRDAAAYGRHLALYRPRVRSVRIDSFLSGMASRLSERITEIAWTRRRAGGGALVPVKNGVIEKAMKDEDIELFDTRIGRRDVHVASHKLGRQAGGKVPLSAGLEDRDASPVPDLDVARPGGNVEEDDGGSRTNPRGMDPRP